MPGSADGRQVARALRVLSDYNARTHSRANMFATVFFGVLDVWQKQRVVEDFQIGARLKRQPFGRGLQRVRNGPVAQRRASAPHSDE